MAVLNNTGIRAGASGAGGGDAYQIEKSLRFNQDDSAYLTRTVSSTGSTTSYTWSGWVKLNDVGAGSKYFLSSVNSSMIDIVSLVASKFKAYPTGVRGDAVLRDPSAWYHLVCAVDTTQDTDSDRIKLYINGEVVTDFDDERYPAEDRVLGINQSGALVKIGQYYTTDGSDFQLAEVHYIDGEQLTASDFGETNADTGQWVPKKYSGSYGTNGFYLKFNNTSDLGEDSSGNDNDWTANNLTASSTAPAHTISDSTYSGSAAAVMDADLTNYVRIASSNYGDYYWTVTFTDPISITSSVKVYSEGETGFRVSINDNANTNTVLDTSTGLKTITLDGETALDKLHFETYTGSGNGHNLYYIQVDGVNLTDASVTDVDVSTDTPTLFDDGGNGTGNYCTMNPIHPLTAATLTQGNLTTTSSAAALSTFLLTSGKWYVEHTVGASAGYNLCFSQPDHEAGNTPSGVDSKTIGYYTTGTFYWGSGASYQSALASSYTTGDVLAAAIDMDSSTIKVYKNNTLETTIDFSAGTYHRFTDGMYISQFTGYGTWNFGARPFAYTPPTGYLALNTYNLPDPTIAISNKHFDLAIDDGADILSTANGLTDGADFVWIKRRADSGFHILFNRINDSGMDGTPNMASNQDYDEDDSGTYSAPSGASVAWVWNAGTANVTNDASATGIGTIDSTYRANPDAGFSIVTYTGNNTDPASVAHGLNAKPALILVKNRDTASKSWVVYHKALGATKYNHLNFSAAATTSADAWDDTEPTSTVWTMQDSSDMNNTDNFVAYVWSEVEGYSKFSEYTGNGSADGPFVYTGFRPTFIIVKRSDANSHWWLFDSVRPSDQALFPGEQDGEQDKGHTFDFLSNGFKLRSTESEVNTNTKPYMYIAFASHPFKYSNAQPIEID